MIVWEYIYILLACLANALWGTSTSFTAETCVSTFPYEV